MANIILDDGLSIHRHKYMHRKKVMMSDTAFLELQTTTFFDALFYILKQLMPINKQSHQKRVQQ